MKKRILEFYQKYPKSEIIDFVKLIYQANFGVAHMIQDEQEAFMRLYQEAKSAHDPLDYPIFEEISSEFVRVHLAPYLLAHHSLYVLFRAFIDTCNLRTKDFESFKRNIECLMDLTKKQKLSFDESSLLYFLQKFDFQAQIPSHSKSYHSIYKPSYRIVNLDFFDFELDKFLGKIKEKIAHTMSKNHTMIVAIDGPATSGKTTLANILQYEYDANIISMDEFFLPDHLQTKDRKFEVGGNIDYDRFITEVLQQLHKDTFTYQAYDCGTKQYTNKTIQKKEVLIVEGVYAAKDAFGEYYDILLYLDIKKTKQLKRIKERNHALYERFIKDWLPQEDLYFVKEETKKKAHLVLSFYKVTI